MDKKTIIAVVISVAIMMTFSFVFQDRLGSTPPPPEEGSGESAVKPAEGEAPQSRGSTTSVPSTGVNQIAAPAVDTLAKEISISTRVFDARFSTRGGVLTSLRFNEFMEIDGTKVEMVIPGETEIYPFRLFLDGYDTSQDVFVQEPVAVSNKIVLSRPYVFREDGREIPFTLKKTFVFQPSDHMIEFRVSLVGQDGVRLPIEDYEFSFGPQIGPPFSQLDGRTAYRRMIYYAEGKRQDYSRKVKQGKLEIADRASWAAIEGKYFVVTAIPYITDFSAYDMGFDAREMSGLIDRKQHSIFFRRAVGRAIEIDEGYKFYVGPMRRKTLESYNDKESNAWRESGLHLEEVAQSSFWGWLSDGLKWLLEQYYKLIPNWGVAIILVTLTIKILFFPLTRKSFESTSKMQELAPKLAEIKEKYKDNPQKQQAESAALYKKEGVSPLGGCLPMLLQLPLFLAMYRLFNSYFELRGAAFIIPWIPDLSGTERLLTLPFTIPFLKTDQLHLLPFLMLGMTFLQQWVSQAHGTQMSSQNKMLMYGMPLFFFFIMYNMPSGLLLYWTMQSLISFLQQFYINSLRRKKTEGGTGDK